MEYAPLSTTPVEARNNASKLAMCLRDNDDARVGEWQHSPNFCGMCGRSPKTESLLLVYVHANHPIGIDGADCKGHLLERLAYHRNREELGSHAEKPARLARLDAAIQQAQAPMNPVKPTRSLQPHSALVPPSPKKKKTGRR